VSCGYIIVGGAVADGWTELATGEQSGVASNAENVTDQSKKVDMHKCLFIMHRCVAPFRKKEHRFGSPFLSIDPS
jgi:hypothetical protein